MSESRHRWSEPRPGAINALTGGSAGHRPVAGAIAPDTLDAGERATLTRALACAPGNPVVVHARNAPGNLVITDISVEIDGKAVEGPIPRETRRANTLRAIVRYANGNTMALDTDMTVHGDDVCGVEYAALTMLNEGNIDRDTVTATLHEAFVTDAQAWARDHWDEETETMHAQAASAAAARAIADTPANGEAAAIGVLIGHALNGRLWRAGEHYEITVTTDAALARPVITVHALPDTDRDRDAREVLSFVDRGGAERHCAEMAAPADTASAPCECGHAEKAECRSKRNSMRANANAEALEQARDAEVDRAAHAHRITNTLGTGIAVPGKTAIEQARAQRAYDRAEQDAWEDGWGERRATDGY